MTLSKLKSSAVTADRTFSPLILFLKLQNAQGIKSIEKLVKGIVFNECHDHSVFYFSWQQE